MFSNVGCPFENSQCISDFNGNYHLEYLPMFIQDLRENNLLIILIILYIIACGVLNYSMTKVIMVESAMVNVILMIFNNCFIWIVGIVITLSANSNEEFMI